MKIVEVSKSNKELVDLVNNSNKEVLKSFIESDFSDGNTIFSCIVGVENNQVKNYSIYTGTKDTRLVQIVIEDPSNKKFLEESITYAFKNLNAYTITIFSEKENRLLEDEGFENLGSDNGIFTYIKEKEMDKEVGRVRI